MGLSDDERASTAFQTLPNELVGAICTLLYNRDIKSLRLTCRALGNKSPLRFDRVFISPNPRNVEVLLAVANHDVFRHRVKEIVWDDAVLMRIPSSDGDGPCGYSADENDPDDYAANEDKEWISRDFVHLCKENISLTKARLHEKNKYQGENEVQKQVDNLMPSRDSLAHYTDLFHQQREVLLSGADEEAFRYAVQRFPQLTKVTVTPAAHGFLFMPLYKTPMIRAFPPGFVYPIPRTWPSDETLGYGSPESCPEGWENDDERRQWRGFCIVSKVLASCAETLQITELVVDNHKLPTGIDYTLFDEPNAEYDSLCKIVARPGFRRLVLSLTTGHRLNFDAEDWSIYQNGRISSLLAKVTDLEEVILNTNYGLNSWSCPMEDSVSLFDIFPIENLSRGKLRHFGLSGIQVTQDDLVSFLSKLPSTLESVNLSFLSMVEGHGNHATLLADLRDKLDWRHRPASQRIKVSISMTLNQFHKGRYVCLDREVQEYIYGDGPPPFIVREGKIDAHFAYGTGIIYDEFDPDFAIPYETNKMRRERGTGISASTV
ncbi:Ff.00g055600.m01.CDS01 [Fusarium sp. VM40]|nr:Ff.00g055600.m01.CDS01 [Fusarium sp. VM40]